MVDKPEIEQGVEIPPRTNRGGHGVTIYPTATMEIGESFVYKAGSTRSASSLVNKVNKRLRDQGKVFSMRTLADGTIRIWRVQ